MANDPIQSPPPPLLDDACALFLDVDGTLIAFSSDPAAVRLLPQVRESIGRISDHLDGAVALVSGRPLSQLDALFAPLRLPAAGLHGHELRGNDHDDPQPQDVPQWLHHLHQRAMRYAHQRPGVLVEDKGSSLALHWRAAPAFGEETLAFAREHLPPSAGYRLQPGDHVVEFVPSGSDKGGAVERLMQQRPFAGRRPLFVGDDLTDEYGFAAAQRAGGDGVLVGTRAPSGARFHLPTIDDVHQWLHACADTLAVRGSAA